MYRYSQLIGSKYQKNTVKNLKIKKDSTKMLVLCYFMASSTTDLIKMSFENKPKQNITSNRDRK